MKKPYVKPLLTRVILRPEEAVLASCKTNQSGGPGRPTCVGHGPMPCFSGGS
jgi:hypothetical protein